MSAGVVMSGEWPTEHSMRGSPSLPFPQKQISLFRLSCCNPRWLGSTKGSPAWKRKGIKRMYGTDSSTVQVKDVCTVRVPSCCTLQLYNSTYNKCSSMNPHTPRLLRFLRLTLQGFERKKNIRHAYIHTSALHIHIHPASL